MSYPPDYFDAPPETDPAPSRCPMCRSAEACDCGNDPSCPHGHGDMELKECSVWGRHYGCPVCFCGTIVLSAEGRKRQAALNDPEVRRFVNEDHRRRGGEG